MIKIYGIKSCTSVRKALAFFKSKNLEIEFFDFKKQSPSASKIASWAKQINIDILMNKKGATYRKLGIKDLNLNNEEKLQWLEKEAMLFKRPVVENGSDVFVGFDEGEFEKRFCK